MKIQHPFCAIRRSTILTKNLISFKNVIGNNRIKGLLTRQLENQTFTQFNIFEGTFGTGKSTTAKLVAMRLTCENPNGADPCCECESCKNNLKAFKTTGSSPNVKIVNFGTFLNKEDVTNLIKDVFVLKSGSEPQVYIFEEVHVLKDLKGAQTAFLEEIDRMPSNVFIIMCTTKLYDVIPELVSRALRYRFSKLTYDESRILVGSIAGDKLPVKTTNLIIRHSRGVPRNLINNTRFVLDNNITAEEYKDFVQDVDEEELCALLLTMQDTDLKSFANLSKKLAESLEATVIQNRMNELMLNALFHLKGVDTDLSDYSQSVVKEVLTEATIDKCLKALEKLSNRSTTSEVELALYKMRMAVQNKQTKDVYADSVYQASRAKETAKFLRMELEDAKVSDSDGNGLQPLNLAKLTQF
jgi:DNA polymerase III gamma/tau subunit